MNNTITPAVKAIYARLRREPVSVLEFNAMHALRDARTIARFRELEAEDRVRIYAEDEDENYFDVFGREDNEKYQKQTEDLIRRWGCVRVIAEYRTEAGEWELADSIGMCIYRNPCSPFENCYVSELMSAAIKQAEAVLAEPAERAEWEARDTITT